MGFAAGRDGGAREGHPACSPFDSTISPAVSPGPLVLRFGGGGGAQLPLSVGPQRHRDRLQISDQSRDKGQAGLSHPIIQAPIRQQQQGPHHRHLQGPS
uniref:Uncharacterized protein n=1 Tax=Knipowitschia caucasica TaxID=637954 RepID=A0AAV2J2V0_KNICA